KDEPRFHHLSTLSDTLKKAPGLDPNRTFDSDIFKNDRFLKVLATSPTAKDVLVAIDDNFCRKRTPLGDTCSKADQLIARWNGGTGPLLAKIDSRLGGKTALPVGIGVYAHPLHGTINGRFDDKALVSQREGGTLESEGGHAMVITGRRKNSKGACEYR